MNAEETRLLKDLLTGPRVLSLAVVVDGVPLVGLLPFAVKPDLSGVVVVASQLARHARGLVPGAPFGVLVHAADEPAGDPLQIARLALEGEVHALQAGTEAWDEALDVYIGRFPEGGQILALGDFGLYELRFKGGRLVGGLARATNLTADTLRKAATAAV